MNQLKNESFIPYTVDKGCPVITHLSFADATGDPLSLISMMQKLSIYENCSGQLINKSKSCFLVNSNTSQSIINDIKTITGYDQQNFPFNYLGAPIYNGSKKVIYFGNSVSKVANRMQGWQGKLISHGGRSILINFVLYSIPLRILNVMRLPKTTIKQIEQLMANFLFWSDGEGKKKMHWIAWKNLCFSKIGRWDWIQINPGL
ncbi:hypothetical protein R3W88_012123 [Solanum pinnatisectum]|uniref:Reverse transcriptase n=1 Tax=Solanum pinnatisectum TaxID=50273 RepID=A0AAV9LAP1_9SOLN|nr:hypothetical protein R3W88_012123 [Solanum pinnatisectum]